MEKTFLALVMLSLIAPVFASEQNNISKEESALKVVPLITSSPLLGTGLGAAVSYLYHTSGDNSSKSQLRIGGQYSDTDSYSLFVNNNAFFNDNDIISTTLSTFSDINNEFPAEEGGHDVDYNVRSFSISQLLMFQVADTFYVGGQLSYKDLTYEANNTTGKEFIAKNAMVDEQAGGIGLAFSFDNRKNKFYPSNATWISLNINTNPSWLGSEVDYYHTIINARHYAKGFKKDDVWAWQLYGQYSSRKTPDTGLPTLSGKSLLRGFPAGQFKARFMTGIQNEYRFQIPNSKFRLVAFAGIARLSGGSYGEGDSSRHDDGWYSAGGVGVRYALQQKTGVDLRLDVVTTSEREESVYLMLNQAF